MPDIQPAHLLDRATWSLPREPGAPRQAMLRRGISDAYYALFHHMTDGVARQALRSIEPSAVRAYRRTLSHAAMKRVSEGVAGPSSKAGPAPLSNAAKASASVRPIAQAFVDLQQERHMADYGHGEVFDARRLQDAIQVAERAITDIDASRTDPAFCAYMSLLALASSWCKASA